jgi:hypothetical protein
VLAFKHANDIPAIADENVLSEQVEGCQRLDA